MRLSYFISLLLPLSTLGQTPKFSKIEFSDSYTIQEVWQDDHGFLWMTSDRGVILFDGYQDLMLTPDSISAQSRDALINVDDILYVATDLGKLELYDTKNTKYLGAIPLPSSAPISSIIRKDSQTLLLSTYGEGLFYFNVYDHTYESISSKASELNYSHSIGSIGDGQYLIGTDQGLSLYNDRLGDAVVMADTKNLIVDRVIISKTGLAWCSLYDSGLLSYDINTTELNFHTPGEPAIVTDLILLDEYPIVSTEHAVYQYNESGRWKKISDEYLLDSRSIETMTIDREHNLWLFSTQGDSWHGNLNFQFVQTDDTHQVQHILKIDTSLLLGSNAGLTQWPSGKEAIPLTGANVTNIIKNHNYIIVGTYNQGIYILDEQLREVTHLHGNNVLADNGILDIEIFSENRYLISTLSGVYIITLDRLHRIIESIEPLSDRSQLNYVIDIFKDNRGRIFFGKDRAGFTISNQGITKDIVQFQGRRLGSINSINQSTDETIWISSTNLGILKYEGDTIQLLVPNTDKNEYYTSIIPLSANRLLLIRKSSIDLYDITNDHIMYFDREAGLETEEAYNNSYTTLDNELWLVHHNEIYRYYPPAKNQAIHPHTKLLNVEVNLQPTGLLKKDFRQHENNIKLEYSAAWLGAPHKVSYSYRLKGYDQSWRYTRDRAVSYPRLPPGDYTFEIRASENNSFAHEPITAHQFVILRAFYNTTLFRLIMLAILAGLIYLVLIYFQKQKEQRQRISQRNTEAQLINLKAQLNPHFLFNSFNTLSGLIEEAPSLGIQFIEELTDYYRSILEIDNSKVIPLTQEIKLVKDYTSVISRRFEDAFNIDNNLVEHSGYIAPLTLQLLIENAVKHNKLSKKDPLIVSISSTPSHIIVSNKIKPKNSNIKSTGTGLHNIQERYRLLGYPNVIISTAHNIYEVSIPIIKQYIP